MKAILLITLLIFAGCATWSTTEKVMFGTMVVGHGIDTYQTSHFIDNTDGITEANPLMNDMTDVVVLKGISIGAIAWLANRYPKYRKLILGIGNGLAWGTVGWNFNVMR